MDKMQNISAALLGFLLVVGHRLAEGCMCAPAHPQDHFCTASYVIKATIMSSKPVTPSGMSFATQYMYQAKVDRVFKSNGTKEGDEVAISMPSKGSPCGKPGLKVGQKYLLTGSQYEGQLYHNLCNLGQEWKDVSIFQRKGLRNFYKRSCDECEISMSYDYRSSNLPASRKCSYDSFFDDEDCEAMYSTCIRESKNSCNWLATSAYQDCVSRRKEGSGYRFP